MSDSWFSKIDFTKIPRHVAIIMDGNGRWATRQNLPRLAGHHQGAEVVEKIVETAQEIGIAHLTLYSFSKENWKRPFEEVEGLMKLLGLFVESKIETLLKKQIALKTIGDLNKLPFEVQQQLEQARQKTAHLKKMSLHLALSYSGRDEILRAVSQLLVSSPQNLSEEQFSKFLDTQNIPDPDLLIRTGGEHRISNFLLWQLAYTELFFTDTLWPDFTPENFLKSIWEYQQRERRFGMIGHQLKTTEEV